MERRKERLIEIPNDDPIKKERKMLLHNKENNQASQQILEDNRERLNAQCKKVLTLLESGKKLTVVDAVMFYQIGDLRRRIKDLKDSGFKIKENHIGHGRKEWFIEQAA